MDRLFHVRQPRPNFIHWILQCTRIFSFGGSLRVPLDSRDLEVLKNIQYLACQCTSVRVQLYHHLLTFDGLHVHSGCLLPKSYSTSILSTLFLPICTDGACAPSAMLCFSLNLVFCSAMQRILNLWSVTQCPMPEDFSLFLVLMEGVRDNDFQAHSRY